MDLAALPVGAVSLSGLFGMTRTYPSENFEIRQGNRFTETNSGNFGKLAAGGDFFYNFDFNTPLEMLVFSVKTVNESCEM